MKENNFKKKKHFKKISASHTTRKWREVNKETRSLKKMERIESKTK